MVTCTNLRIVQDRICRSANRRLRLVLDLCERCGRDMVIAESDGYFAGMEETANLRFCVTCQRAEREARTLWAGAPVGESARHVGAYCRKEA